jgi:hypothetical protein
VGTTVPAEQLDQHHLEQPVREQATALLLPVDLGGQQVERRPLARA